VLLHNSTTACRCCTFSRLATPLANNAHILQYARLAAPQQLLLSASPPYCRRRCWHVESWSCGPLAGPGQKLPVHAMASASCEQRSRLQQLLCRCCQTASMSSMRAAVVLSCDSYVDAVWLWCFDYAQLLRCVVHFGVIGQWVG
jgi:hypothetical protein